MAMLLGEILWLMFGFHKGPPSKREITTQEIAEEPLEANPKALGGRVSILPDKTEINALRGFFSEVEVPAEVISHFVEETSAILEKEGGATNFPALDSAVAKLSRYGVNLQIKSGAPAFEDFKNSSTYGRVVASTIIAGKERKLAEGPVPLAPFVINTNDPDALRLALAKAGFDSQTQDTFIADSKNMPKGVNRLNAYPNICINIVTEGESVFPEETMSAFKTSYATTRLEQKTLLQQTLDSARKDVLTARATEAAARSFWRKTKKNGDNSKIETAEAAYYAAQKALLDQEGGAFTTPTDRLDFILSERKRFFDEVEQHALAEKPLGLFRKAYRAYANTPAWARVGGTTVLATAGVAGLITLTGGTIGLVPLATYFGKRLTTAVISTTIGASAAEVVGGARRRQAQTLEARGDKALLALDPQKFEDCIQAIDKEYTARKRFTKKTVLLKLLTGVATGGVTGIGIGMFALSSTSVPGSAAPGAPAAANGAVETVAEAGNSASGRAVAHREVETAPTRPRINMVQEFSRRAQGMGRELGEFDRGGAIHNEAARLLPGNSVNPKISSAVWQELRTVPMDKLISGVGEHNPFETNEILRTLPPQQVESLRAWFASAHEAITRDARTLGLSRADVIPAKQNLTAEAALRSLVVMQDMKGDRSIMEQITNPPPRPRTVPAAPPPIPPAPAVAVAPVAIPVEISQGSAMGERAMGAISAARAIPEAHEPTAVRANLPGHEAEIAAIRDRIGNLMAANAVNAERIAALDPVSGEVRGQAPGFDQARIDNTPTPTPTPQARIQTPWSFDLLSQIFNYFFGK